MSVCTPSTAQELFPNTEPASTIPKKVIGFRQTNELYKDNNSRPRYYSCFRFMYGATRNLSIIATLGISNHHLKKFPDDLTYYIVNHHRVTFPVYPDLFEGIHLYAKYRVINLDGEQKHFRIAVYGEGSRSLAVHTEGETNLMTDNTGYGGGLIFTRLYKRFAASVTWGFMRSLPYETSNEFRKIKFKSGDAMQYNVSFGYRLYPRMYDSYKNININLYAEFINKDYKAAEIFYNDVPYNYDFLRTSDAYTYNGFTANAYSELRTSVQFILDSSTRLDLGMALPVYGRSYLHDYPLILISVQKYFFK